MDLRFIKAFLFVSILLNGSFLFAQNDPPRQKININREWKFKLGDEKAAQAPAYNDAGWDNVNLPHNFSIPYFQSAQWYNGYGWYRKHFQMPGAWKGKRVSVEFEAAFRVAEIFVNGNEAGKHSGGYTGFSFDITPYLQAGENILAVRLNNEWSPRLAPRNGDHNFIGGIYRDVYLVVTNDVHVAWYGTYVTTPQLSKKSGRVNIETEIENSSKQNKTIILKTDIMDAAGKKITGISTSQLLKAGETATVKQLTPVISQPTLWSPQQPYLYKAVNTILEGKKVMDTYETTFGFRWMRWSADSGFFLNGERYYFHGANVHQDHAGWANAITNAAIIRDVKMVKDCGMDFIRGSHYPHDPAFSAACDSLGILLWEENDFWGSGGNQKDEGNWYNGAGAYPPVKEDQPYFDSSVKADLREMVRIHRNHPSIIAWSMCNEPFFTNGSTMPRVREFLKELVQLTRQFDPTRGAGIGGSQRGGIDTLGDIAGYNGDGARLYIHPKVANVVTEYGSTIAIRPGKYEPGWGDLAKQIDSGFLWRSGEALWCAFDYGTRAGDFGKMGMVDYFRLPKNMWYWYRNAYKQVPPPDSATGGIAAKMKLTADKNYIAGVNGTDDVFLTVSVQDKDGRQLSNSPDVTLQIVSGPGEFPTGRSITFSNRSDIYIRDGKAAIEFRSYYGGKTVIKAVSSGLQTDSLAIETKGSPQYVEGVSPQTKERPYTRYEAPEKEGDIISIAYQKPTFASSELPGNTANLANDNDLKTFWQPADTSTEKWWQLDMENLYTISQVNLSFAGAQNASFKIELSKDNQHWENIGESAATNSSLKKSIQITNKAAGRFLRIIFINESGVPTLAEVEVFGKTIN